MISCFDGENAFLSNFYDSTIDVDGIIYPTVEHFFQAQKTLDTEERKGIAALPTPGKAKRAGRKVVLRPDWDDVKISQMEIGLRAKFSDPILAKKLIDTGDQELLEGNNWHDNFWGSCSCPRCRNLLGENNLGQLLMRIRKELKGMG